MPNEIHIPDLPLDPVGLAAEPDSPKQFAGSLADRTVAELGELLQVLEAELAQPTARSQVRRELDEVVAELERRETDRRTQVRRDANFKASRRSDAESMTGKPGGWIHGRPLDERERQDLAAFIRWVVKEGSA